MINLNVSTATRRGLNLVIILGIVLALYLGQRIFIPTILALLLAAMLWPLALGMHHTGLPNVAFERRSGFPWVSARLVPLRLPWGLACMLSVILLIALTILVTVGFALAVPKLLADLPSDPPRQQAAYEQFKAKLEKISPVDLDPEYFPPNVEDSVFRYLKQTVDPEKPYVVNLLWQVAGYGGSWVWQWILILFILLFLLLEGRTLTRRVVEIVGPSAEAQAKAVAVLRDMASQVRTYLVWRTLVNFGLAVVVGLFYHLMGLKQPWTWALLTAILCYVPYLGPIAAGIPPVIDAFVTCPSPWYAVAVLVFYLIVINIEGYVIVPVVMGRPMELNATTVLLSCLFWELVWGLPGLFLAMPLMAAVKAVCTHVPGWEPWANLMSTREPDAKPAVSQVLSADAVLDEDTQILTPEEAAALGGLRHEMARKEL